MIIPSILMFLGLLAFLAGIYAFYSEITFLSRFEKESKKRYSYTPSVSVLVPTRGNDDNLENNILSILDQDYRNAEYIFIVDSKDDPAFNILQKIKRKDFKIVISRKRECCSGKVSALLLGLKHAKNEVLVFADTDVYFKKGWLQKLVSGLEISDLTTGYRFYYPDKTFLSYVRSAWSNIGLRLMFHPKSSFAWGGSMAIRKKTFYELKIPEVWQKVLSDDISLTNIVRLAGKKMIFNPNCICLTKNRPSFREFREFSNRQYLIVKYYAPTAFLLGSIVLMAAAIAILLGFVSLFFSYYLQASLFLFSMFLYLIKDAIAFRFYKKNLDIEASNIYYVLGGIIAFIFNLYNFFHSLTSNSIEWKGKKYIINGYDDIKIETVTK